MKKSWKRSLSLLVAVVMVLAMLPASALALDPVSPTTQGECCDGHDTSHTGWKVLGEENVETAYHVNKVNVGGNFVLAGDITFAGTINVSADTHICLNGHNIYQTSSGNLFTVNNASDEVTFTLCDCSSGEPGELNGSRATGGDTIVAVRNNATFNLYGGKLTGKAHTSGGPGVRLEYATAVFNMRGGEISGNQCTSTGATASHSIFINNGAEFNMYGGKISGNTPAGNAKPSVLVYNGNVELTEKAVIEDTISRTAGTVTVKDLNEGAKIISSSKLTIPSGDQSVGESAANNIYTYTYRSPIAQVGDTNYYSFEDAIAAALTAGTATVKVVKDTTMNKTVCVNPGEHLTIDLNGYRVTIAENAAAIKPTSGRQTYNSIFRLESSKEGKVAKLTITDTSAEKDGMFDGEGAEGIKNFVRIDQDGEFYLEGGTITNVTGSAAGAVVTTNISGAKFEMSGGKITGNTATYATKGVIVYAYKGTFNMTGGEISGNTPAAGYSDVDRSSGTITISGSAVMDTLGSGATLGKLTAGARIVSKASLTVSDDAKGTVKRETVDGKYVYTYIVYHTMQNVLLQDLIKVGFFFKAPDNASSVGALVWTKEAYEAETNRTATNEDARYSVRETTDGYVVETAGVKAQNLDQVFVMIPYAVVDGEYVYGAAQEYSVLDYAKKAYETEAEPGSDLANARTLIIDLLNYATAARNYFYTRDGKIDNAAPLNSILSAADKEVNWDSATMSRYYAAGTTNGTLDITRYGRSASLLEAIQLNVFYTGDSFSAAKYWLDAADKQDATVSSVTVSGVDMTKVSIPNIYSFNIYDDYSLQPVEGDAVGNTTVTSVAAYLTKVVESNNDAACVALAKAMMVYGFHADAIFNQ